MKKTMKFLHEVGTVGVMGSVAAQFVLAAIGAELPPEEHAIVRQGVLALSRFLLLPSLLIVLLSGVFAMAIHKPFHNADWAWVKVLMTPLLLEGTFMAVDGPARAAAKLSKQVVEGSAAAAEALERTLGHERWGLGVVFVLYTANVVLAVWRPRLRPRVPGAADAASPGALTDDADAASTMPASSGTVAS